MTLQKESVSQLQVALKDDAVIVNYKGNDYFMFPNWEGRNYQSWNVFNLNRQVVQKVPNGHAMVDQYKLTRLLMGKK